MRKKRKIRKKAEKRVIDIYMGGERDPGSKIIPKKYGYFFSKKKIFLALTLLVVMLLIAELSI